jgi:hypothetical protein
LAEFNFKQNTVTRMTTTKSYDYLNRLTQISSASSQLPTPISYSYTYNAANQRTHTTLADGSYWIYGYGMTATNGMTNVTHLKNNTGSSFTLLTYPVTMERSFHLSFRTLQHKGRPHPVLSRSTPRNFPLGLSPKISRSTELEARPHLALCLLIIPQPPHKQMPKIGELDFGLAPVWWTTVIQ